MTPTFGCRRGFRDRVQCGVGQFLATADGLWRDGPAEELFLSVNGMREHRLGRPLAECEQLRHVRKLSLVGSWLDDPFLVAFLACPAQTSWRELWLHGDRLTALAARAFAAAPLAGTIARLRVTSKRLKSAGREVIRGVFADRVQLDYADE